MNNPLRFVDPTGMAASDTTTRDGGVIETVVVIAQKGIDYITSTEFAILFGDFMSGGQVSDMNQSLALYETEGLNAYLYSEIGSATRDARFSMMGQYRGGKWGNFRKVLPRNDRLSLFIKRLKDAKRPNNPKEALKLINKTLDDIEIAHSGTNDRMYGILDNKYVTYHANGNVTALTKGHRIEIQSNGSFSIYLRSTGELFFEK